MRMLAWLLLACASVVQAENKVLNVYAWTNYIPPEIIHQFEAETNIKVNFSTFENNEVMYAKLRATNNTGYDLIMPSSYFVDRMRRQNMLEKLDHSKLSNWKNLNPALLNPVYDPDSQYSLPFVWGITGIFVNDQTFAPNSIQRWSDLWNSAYTNQLLLLDDTREVFSMALIALGYSANDTNPEHIKAAFYKLKALTPNIKVYSSDAVISMLIDEDVNVGMAWNGDVYKAREDNMHVKFILPKDGFVVWVDTFAIPKTAAHKAAAYAFLNFILRANIAKDIALYTTFATPNAAGQKLLPPAIRDNKAIYPPADIMRRGQFQTDVSDGILALYEKYWEQLKMGG